MNVRVDRARLHGGVSDDRARLTDALERISPAAIGLSPQAVLVVRRLAPRARLTRHGARDAFVTGVQEELRSRVVTARRGRKGRDDEDLLFDDDADLQAAIVADWLEAGRPSGVRWWSQIIESRSPLVYWRKTVLHDPRRLAAAVLRLAEQGRAAEWLATFERAELIAAAGRMLQMQGAAPEAIAVVQAGISDIAPRDQRRGLADLAAIVPEAKAVERQDVAVLIAVSAVLMRRPAWLGASSFARALAVVGRFQHPAKTTGPRVPAIAAERDVSIPPSAAPSAPAKTNRTSDRRRGKRELGLRPASWMPAEPVRTSAPPPPSLQDRGAEPAVFAPPPPIVATEFGGLFFVLNVFMALGLYGDFTRPGDGLRGLSPFELLLLLGRRWFGTPFEADPLGAMLRDLAGLQPGEVVGRHFDAPVWSVPDAWLSPWPGAARKGRGPGFVLADDPDRPRTTAWRRRRWVACLAGYLRARLGRALGEIDARTALLITCTQPGRVTRLGDKVEVHFPLADHPIALRIAGLDRDPGWIPAAGHFIEFRFT